MFGDAGAIGKVLKPMSISRSKMELEDDISEDMSVCNFAKCAAGEACVHEIFLAQTRKNHTE